MSGIFVFPPAAAGDWLPYILVYLAAVSLISVCITVADKIKARAGAWRIPEATLLLFSALGGSVAMYITMQLIRHKTKHLKFMLGIPLIFLFQVILTVFLVKRFIL